MAAKFKSFGIAPTAQCSPSGWSIPTICMPDGSYITDSRKIADVLEALKPEPSLRLDSGYVERMQAVVSSITDSLSTILIPRVPDLLLNESSGIYFRETRAKLFDMTLEEFAKSEGSGEVAWKNAEAGIKELVKILRERLEGPFVLGKDPSYPDFILAGLCAFVERLNQSDIFDRFIGHDDALLKHWQACQIFLARDDH